MPGEFKLSAASVSSIERSPGCSRSLQLGEAFSGSVGLRIACSCLPRREIVSWHSANFTAVAAISIS